jgi:DNA polymerase III delta prime subunit
MSESPNPITKPVILPYQKSIYERLCAVARACLFVDRTLIGPIKLRANFMLIGPTGTGKSFLAKEIAKEMRVPFLSVSASDWIILGGNTRGSTVTWPNIVQFIKKSADKQGAIIFVDELCKVHHDSNWNAFLRTEIFSLCDGRVPLGVKDSEDDTLTNKEIEEIEFYLTNKTMIIGGAAFQGIWEERSAQPIGFNLCPEKATPPSLHELTKFLPRELINRFSSEIFVLPKLSKSDYLTMIETMAENISATWRQRFLELGRSRLDQAVLHQKGARYAEEILLAAIVAERSCMKNWKPECEAPETATDAPEVPDDPDESISVF